MKHLVLCAALAALAGGCSDANKDGPRVQVKVKLTDKGKPFEFDAGRAKMPPGVGAPPGVGGGGVQVSFHSEGATDVVYAQRAADGTYEASVKPGRYKIALFVGNLPPGTADPFGGKFTPQATQIAREVKGGEELTLDVSKPQG